MASPHLKQAYQIDCSATSAGRKFAASKRRIRWRFGFVNAKALEEGHTGVDCRGEEHEVTLSWSLASGKRIVLADGEEVHFSVGRRTEGKFETTWPMKGNFTISIIAHAAPPLKPKPGWKQFDLKLNGKSHSDLPRLFELGPGIITSRPRAGNARVHEKMKLDREEEMTWAHNVDQHEMRRSMTYTSSNNSLPGHSANATDRRHSMPEIMPVDLLSDSNPAIEAQNVPVIPVEIHQNYPAQDEFNPNEPPSYDAIRSSIMGAYSSSESVSDGQEENLKGNSQDLPSKQPFEKYPSFKDEQTETSIATIASPRSVAAIDNAMKNLVNLEDISSPASRGEKVKLTMMPTTDDKSKTSRGIPPKAGTWNLGSQPRLAELKSIKVTTNTQTKEIMKTPTFSPTSTVASPGALVVYGQPQGYNNYGYPQGFNNFGPPPLHKVTGFGVGASYTVDTMGY